MRVRVCVVAVSLAALLLPVNLGAAEAAPAIKFGVIQYDSPGSDGGSNASLNAEWVTIKNTSGSRKTLTGWTLRDPQGHVFRFPTFRLGAGKSVRVHTGRGTNDRNDLYWREDNYVWNNTGDRAILKNSGGTVVDRCSWGDGDGTIAC